jgi:uncharacterized protein (TIRG00374 family)
MMYAMSMPIMPPTVSWSPHSAQSRALTRALIVSLGIGLLYVALRDVQFSAVLAALSRLQLRQLALVAALDALIYILITARWWFVIRAHDPHAPFVPLVAVRLAVFSISYFTVGPQIGGEPLQVIYLRSHRRTSYARATASVVLDKLLELMANFVFLAFGLTAVVRLGLVGAFDKHSVLLLGALTVLMAWPLAHILLLVAGQHPVSWFLGVVLGPARQSKAARYIRVCEHLASRVCRRRPRLLLAAAMMSIIACGATVIEYGLIASFLGVSLSFWQAVAGWTASAISFLMPLPGGLGALEAGQVFALGAFGIAAGAALSIGLVMRARDVMIAGIGLALGGAIAVESKSAFAGRGVVVDKERRAPVTAAAPQSGSARDDPHE